MFVEEPARGLGWRWASRWTSASARLTSRPLALVEAGPQIRPRTRRPRQRTLHLTGNIHSITCPPGQCFSVTLQCTAKKKCRKLEANIPRKGISGPLSPNFHIHVSVSELYIPMMELPFLLEEICGSILGIFKSLTYT